MIEIINKKPLSEIKEEKEMEKIEVQADVFEVIACLYEDMEALANRVQILEIEIKALKGGAS